MIHIKTIPAHKSRRVILGEELDIEQHEIDGSYLLSQESGSITITDKQYLAMRDAIEGYRTEGER